MQCFVGVGAEAASAVARSADCPCHIRYELHLKQMQTGMQPLVKDNGRLHTSA